MERHIFAVLVALIIVPSPLAQAAPPNSPFGHKPIAKTPDALPDTVLHRLGTPCMHQPNGVASIAITPNGAWMATGDRAESLLECFQDGGSTNAVT